MSDVGWMQYCILSNRALAFFELKRFNVEHQTEDVNMSRAILGDEL